MKLHPTNLLAAAAILLAASVTAPSAHAVPIFLQTPTTNTGGVNDADYAGIGARHADDFTLGAAATARSVTWRGMFFQSNTLTFPLSFDLTIYADNAGSPGAVLSTTPITFNSIGEITDTGIDFSNHDVYEFAADLTPTSLLAGTPYWFSPLADTTNDGDDLEAWLWTSGATVAMNEAAALQLISFNSGQWMVSNTGPFYFILDDSPLGGGGANVPEPATATLGLIGIAGLLMRRKQVA